MKKELRLKVHFMPGDGHGWALDEDRRQMRQALEGLVDESSLARAQVMHTPFWQGLSSVHPETLQQKLVIAHADNPPFFYFKQPEFLQGERQVDLWVARSQEALKQFEALRLPVTYIPYAIDETLFFPIKEKKELRRKFALPQEAYVIANFHRDSEGADLSTPKFQKAPELLLAIFKELQAKGISFHVLLAGPRRHWIREALKREGIPFTFVGKSDVRGDDFGVNILERSVLNELINAADLMLLSSRWEGGPQAIMEGAAAGVKILSTPVGLAHDILEPLSCYDSISQAVDRITNDQEDHILESTLLPQWKRWKESHTMQRMKKDLQQLYSNLAGSHLIDERSSAASSWMVTQGRELHYQFRQRYFPKKTDHLLGWNHQFGADAALDAIFSELEIIVELSHLTRRPANGQGIEFIGWPTSSLPPAQKGSQRFQWVTPSLPLSLILPETRLLLPSIEDILYLRGAGLLHPALVFPLPCFKRKEALSNEPLLIEEGSHSASLEIWKAMAAGRPIIYPASSAYYEQVFHAGFAYRNRKEIPTLLQLASEEAPRLRILSRIPSRESASQLLRKLLECSRVV